MPVAIEPVVGGQMGALRAIDVLTELVRVGVTDENGRRDGERLFEVTVIVLPSVRVKGAI